MGGMFDPVHQGHIELAQQVKDLCKLNEVLLVPCGTPVHRPQANAPAEARIAMLQLACSERVWLSVDARECRNESPSYTYNTLNSIYSEQPDVILHLLLGLDAFLALPTWYRWHDLFTLAHLVVVARPGYELSESELEPALRQELAQRKVRSLEDSQRASSGKILLLNVPTPAISSTKIRHMLKNERDVSHYLNRDVATYIHKHKLYK